MTENVTAFMRDIDIAAFKAAAKHFSVYIAVRRTNKESLDYIGKVGYVPKRLDCKAKTADHDAVAEGRQRQCAGLVVDPELMGRNAFRDSKKHEKAVKEWHGFKSLLAPPMLTEAGQRAYTYLPNGGHYVVQLDKNHKHYGCVMFCSDSLVTGGKYIHGDYDLYAIVPAAGLRDNVFVQERRLGQPHARGKELFDVQHFVNKRIGAPMVLHGEQEHYSDDTDDSLDVFFPDGQRVETFAGSARIKQLYRENFSGRPLHGKHSPPTTSAGGLWRKA